MGQLHHLLDLWPSQKARTPRLIPDALSQPLDDSRRFTKGGARLLLLSTCLIQASQRRLDLPALCWQPEICCQLDCFAQVADGLLSLPIPRCEGRQRAQVGKAVAPIGPQMFPQSAYCFSRPNPAQHFAARFAGKEAVGKAIGCGVEFMWRDIEIAGRPKPAVTLSGQVADLARWLGAGAIDLSMTHSRGMAGAVAIVHEP